ncbi:hypothetical protein FHS16_003467 [Paenibacillus endophyticus]|uniref:YhfM-like domain-containing protein n=1 Tax=Paenibacillus endophyticus TaxID=1294268 RepID=A0A7W5C9Y5_9BACL|nr:hypothetical protein [Paenibacillus endophyticus]MBB3153405.1 hypothetical protein [Paenibacillus endophyticus]
MHVKNTVLAMAATVLLLTGCAADAKKPIVASEQDVVAAPASHISIAKISGGSNETVVFSEKEQVEAFKRAVQTAQELPGILNVSAADYAFTITLQLEARKYLLWLGPSEQQGMIMNAKETHKGYALTTAATAELLQLVEADARLDNAL